MSMRGETTAEAPATPTSDDPSRLGLALLVIAAAQLLIVLDNTITYVALPSIQAALRLGGTELSWVITAYALAFGGVLLAGGRAGDLFGHRRVFRAGLVVFGLASLLGGLAWAGGWLVAARAVQGLGAALIAPCALSLLATTFPAGPARNRALGVYGGMGAVGSVIGLLLGGVLTEYASWRWVLLVNVPIAAAVLAGSSVLVAGRRGRGAVDLPGALTVTLGLGSLIYAISRAAGYGWGDPVTLVFLVAAAVLLAAVPVVERRAPTPMLPFRVLRDRGRVGANIVMLLSGAVMFALFYFLTLHMQRVTGWSASRTGLAYLPFTAGIGLAAGVFGPKLLARFAERTVIAAGLLVAAIGLVWFTALRPSSSVAAVLLPAQLVCGAGFGLVVITVTVVGVRGAAPEETGIAAGLINTSQQIGGALGLTVLAALAAAVGADPAVAAAVPDALARGHRAGFAAGAALCLAAMLVAVLTVPGHRRRR